MSRNQRQITLIFYKFSGVVKALEKIFPLALLIFIDYNRIIHKESGFTESFRWAYIGNGSIARSTASEILKGEHKIVCVYVH